MQKNVAGQKTGTQMVGTDGTAFTGTVTVYVTGDAGTQAIGSVGSGICTHEGNGYHTYAPAQAETNYDVIAFTYIGTGAVPVTESFYPPTDTVAADIAALQADLDSLTTTVGGIVTDLGTPDTSIAADIAAAQADLDDIQTRLPAALVSGRMDSSTGAMAANTLTATAINADAITAAKLAADVTTELQSGLATAAAVATVDTVVDAILAMLDDARTEPGQGAPPVNPDLATKIDYLYKFLRNKKDNDGTETKIYADNGTTVDHKQSTSEAAGTVTVGEVVTGA